MQVSASTFQAGPSGIQAGQRTATQAAGDLASLPAAASSAPAAGNQDLGSLLVQLDLGRQQVESAAKVVKTADEVMGTLIDTHA
ncbi:hypothetical protein [Stutzerimonas azotifigens]|uniref:hypothetical protein n=1 Tax=Stutzerimonas azotifigens TaxID=291995 RepID=UPI000426FF98|nr:hypothetical protein [Stutzerimonas azotifigens]